LAVLHLPLLILILYCKVVQGLNCIFIMHEQLTDSDQTDRSRESGSI
jgi:hypothetical protein